MRASAGQGADLYEVFNETQNGAVPTLPWEGAEEVPKVTMPSDQLCVRSQERNSHWAHSSHGLPATLLAKGKIAKY